MKANQELEYVAPSVSDHLDAVQLTQGEGDNDFEENIVWGNNAVPVGVENPTEDLDE